MSNQGKNLTNAARGNATGIIIAAAGIFIQFLVGVPGFPAVPPGPIILTVAAIAVVSLVARWRWVTVIGLIAPLFIAVGAILEGSTWGRLGNPGDFGPFIGALLQWIGLVIALVAGVLGVRASAVRLNVRA